MRYLWLLVFLAFSGFARAQQADCFTVVVGQSASATGRVIAAHNEDDGGNLIVNLYKVPANFFKEADSMFIKDDPWFERRSNELLWFQTTRQEFGDAYMNEKGIVIFSNQCRSREDTATGLLTHQLRRIVIEYAESARHGVKILGHLVEKFGYGSSGRTYTIADNQEAFIVAVVQGRRWIAKRVPDNSVAVIPNYYTIDRINFADTVNYMFSPDILTYAIRRRWYEPEEGKYFSFREAYADPRTLEADWNKPRHWAALRYLKPSYYFPDSYYGEEDFPFAVEPDTVVGREMLEHILSDHFEDSDLARKDSLSTPHRMKPLPVCHRGNKFSMIVTPVSKYPGHEDNIVWWAPVNPCMHPYVPVSFAIRKIPRHFQSYPL
ncbi:MAG: dipeptidase, partial [Chlorobi bacterium]|nr:dipeptidase [Chlorobiota bacterium]